MKKRMKACASTRYSAIFPTEDEMMVAQILLDLGRMPYLSLLEYLPNSNWNGKKRRSCLKIKTAHRTPTSPNSPFAFTRHSSKENSRKGKRVCRRINFGSGLTHHHPDSMAQEIRCPITVQSQPSNSGANRVGPIGFDLNAPAYETLDFVVDELRPLDVNTLISDRRAEYVEARRTRRRIMMIKSIKNGGWLHL